MCGIVGLLPKQAAPPDEGLLRRMTETLAHRGPDGEGFWTGEGIGLGHRRLAIIDLSDSGAQPMWSTDKRYVIVQNGEIYNYQTLRKELEASGARFHTASDTEAILEAYRAWGSACVEHLRGMFAFAIWDTQRKELFFARDRIGKKPFFYRTLKNGAFAFASEIKALLRAESAGLDEGALRLFLGLQYVPSPRTGFEGIFGLPPGHRGTVKNGECVIERYHAWQPESVTDADAEIRSRLERATRARLVADVPVGAFLSGGVDSAAVVAFASKHVAYPLRTFTMGFPDTGLDERAEARAIAAHFKTDHMEFEAHPADLARMAERIVAQYDAPYADSSALPLMLLSEKTAEQIKVVLTGDGGDEVFGGYRRYGWFETADRLRRSGLSWPAINIAWAAWGLNGRDPRFRRFAETLEGIRKSYGRGYADLLTGSYFGRDDLPSLLQPSFLAQTPSFDASDWIASHYDESLGVAGAMALDLGSYLPDDLNVKMDRATMAFGLEARSPFLAPSVVSLGLGLPFHERVNHGKTKIALKRALHGVVPDAVLSRKKRGFQVPLASWFRGPLKAHWKEHCLDPQGPLSRYVRLNAATRLLEENDRVDHGNRLWMLYALSLWLSIHA